MNRLFLAMKRPLRALVAIVVSLTMIAATVVVGAQSATAAANDPVLYWMGIRDSGGEGDISASIGRMPVANPSKANEDFIANITPSYSVAADGKYVYWLSKKDDDKPASIARAPINNPSAIEEDFVKTTADYAYSLVTSNGYIYWIEPIDDDNGVIKKVHISNPSRIETVVGGVVSVALAVDSGWLFWGEQDGHIGRVSLSDHRKVERNWFASNGMIYFGGLAASSGYVYWFDGATGNVGRVRISQTSQNNPEFIKNTRGTPPFVALAADSDSVYMAEYGEGDVKTSIYAVKLANTTNKTKLGEYDGTIYDLTVNQSSNSQAKSKQSFRKGATPKKIKFRGTTVINKRGATTKQKQPLKAKVSIRLSRGELACARVVKGAKRKVSIRTYGKCSFRVKVTYTAPGNAKYYKFSKSKTYRVKR